HESGTFDITLAVYGVATAITSAMVVFVTSPKNFYWDGLGTRRFDPSHIVLYDGLALLLIFFTIVAIIRKLWRKDWNPSRFEKLALRILLVINIVVPVISVASMEPGFKSRARGFAERLNTKFVLTNENRDWARDFADRTPDARLTIMSC